MENHDHCQESAGLGEQGSSCLVDEARAEGSVDRPSMYGLASSSYFRPEGASLDGTTLLGPSK